MEKKEIRIGLVGAGTVGGGVVKLLREQESYFRDKLGLHLTLARVVDKDDSRLAALPACGAILSSSPGDVLGDSSIDIAVELMGGTGYAREFVLAALRAGKHVVTANKALLAQHGPAIFREAERNNVSVYFEASVGGGMPVIKTIREAMIGNDISSLKTIINGTCNYILTQNDSGGHLLRRGPEPTPRRRALPRPIPSSTSGAATPATRSPSWPASSTTATSRTRRSRVEGIKDVTSEDIEFARELGYTIKLLGVIRRERSEEPVEARVHPAMLRKDHILASVSDSYNAVLLRGSAVGDILLYGKGAGEMPTASAVVSDLVDVARNIAGGTPRRIPMDYYDESRPLPVKAIGELASRYYLRFSVVDVAGVLAAMTSVFARHSISIASVVQREPPEWQRVSVIFVTHEAVESSLRAAVGEIEAMDFVREKAQVIRIED